MSTVDGYYSASHPDVLYAGDPVPLHVLQRNHGRDVRYLSAKQYKAYARLREQGSPHDLAYAEAMSDENATQSES